MLTKADIQRLRSLREKKHREALGRFVVEGEKVIGELLDSGFPFLELYATPAWGEPALLPSSLAVTRVTAAEMGRISHFPTPASVLAVGAITHQPLAVRELERGLTLALDGVQDAGNVGTLLRIADWFGFARLVVSRDCADVFNQKVINASMGSFARVPVHRCDLAALLFEITSGTPIIGCELEGRNVFTFAPVTNAVVVIGSEGRGLSPDVRTRVTQRITIPRFGRAESLNAAVAAGIICAQLRRL